MQVIMAITVMIATTAADQLMDITGPATAADITEGAGTGPTIIEMAADALINITDIIEADITSGPTAGMMNMTGTTKTDILM
jgi:hypothetical protein